jgi:hypothetical protein
VCVFMYANNSNRECGVEENGKEDLCVNGTLHESQNEWPSAIGVNVRNFPSRLV